MTNKLLNWLIIGPHFGSIELVSVDRDILSLMNDQSIADGLQCKTHEKKVKSNKKKAYVVEIVHEPFPLQRVLQQERIEHNLVERFDERVDALHHVVDALRVARHRLEFRSEDRVESSRIFS